MVYLDQCLENDSNLLQKLGAQSIKSVHTDLDLFRSVIDVGQRRASKSVCHWASNIIDCTMGKSSPGSCPSKVVYDGVFKCIPQQLYGTDVCDKYGNFETRCAYEVGKLMSPKL